MIDTFQLYLLHRDEICKWTTRFNRVSLFREDGLLIVDRFIITHRSTEDEKDAFKTVTIIALTKKI